jgi:4-hydroxy-3-methylbut-2-enyl diphosphate reductase
VHNPQVVSRLERQGVKVIRELGEAQGEVVVIPSHGAAASVFAQLRERGLRMVDATCPFVRQAQKAARELAEAGFAVVVFGDAQHPEVRGVLGWAEEKGMATLEEEEVLKLRPLPRRLGILSQTTQSPAQFSRFVSRCAEALLPRLKALRVVNTICDATRQRQSAALELARKADLVLVIGGKNSSNSRRLAEICSAAGVETHLIETAAELEESWLRQKRYIGVTAGASTPDEAIREVIQWLERFAQLQGQA